MRRPSARPWAGDVVIIGVTERGTAEIIPAAVIPKDQIWFYHPEMQERVREAEADMASGRTTRVRTPAELTTRLAQLKGESHSG